MKNNELLRITRNAFKRLIKSERKTQANVMYDTNYNIARFLNSRQDITLSCFYYVAQELDVNAWELLKAIEGDYLSNIKNKGLQKK